MYVYDEKMHNLTGRWILKFDNFSGVSLIKIMYKENDKMHTIMVKKKVNE